MKIEIQQHNNLLFEGKNEQGATITFGRSENPDIASLRPMELLLFGLAGCSSVDVIGILQKQKQVIKNYKVTVHGERTKAIPAVFKTIQIQFELVGEIDEQKAARAIDLSINKYCSVSQILSPTASIETSFKIHSIHSYYE